MELFADNAQTTLAANIAAGDSSLTVASTSVFPSSGNFRILVDSEIMLVTSVSGTSFNVSRGLEGPAATAHSAGAPVTQVVTALSLSQSLPAPHNYLINGGFDLAQRQTPGTLTSIGSSDSYSADRWKAGRQNSNLQYQRADTNGALESGISARFYGTYKQITNAGKFLVYQIVEGSTTLPLAGQLLTFQCKMKTSSAKTIRMAILQLGSSGTLDTIPNPIQTAWGANSTDPTWGTNLSVVGSVVSQSVTTSWTAFTVTVTAPSNAKNLICAVWTDSQFSANDSLSITEAGLYISAGLQAAPWIPRLIQAEVALSQRYYEKSYDLDTAPGSSFSVSGTEGILFVNATGSGPSYSNQFKVNKRAAPTLTLYDAAGTSGKVSYYNGAWNNGGTPNVSWTMQSLFAAGISNVQGFSYAWSADAEL